MYVTPIRLGLLKATNQKQIKTNQKVNREWRFPPDFRTAIFLFLQTDTGILASGVDLPSPPEMKPSSSYSILKFVYLTDQWRHSLEVHPLLRKILDPPLCIGFILTLPMLVYYVQAPYFLEGLQKSSVIDKSAEES